MFMRNLWGPSKGITAGTNDFRYSPNHQPAWTMVQMGNYCWRKHNPFMDLKNFIKKLEHGHLCSRTKHCFYNVWFKDSLPYRASDCSIFCTELFSRTFYFIISYFLFSLRTSQVESLEPMSPNWPLSVLSVVLQLSVRPTRTSYYSVDKPAAELLETDGNKAAAIWSRGAGKWRGGGNEVFLHELAS